MKKLISACVLSMAIMSCGNSSTGDQSMYDTTANAAPGVAAARDSMATAAARDSSKDSSKKSAVPDSAAGSGGGVPKGTIDSGMTNTGAHHHGPTHRKK